MIYKPRQWSLGDECQIMGILNVTPDSFSDGGKNIHLDKAIQHAHQMLLDGAHVIDVGGESTRPGAQEVSTQEELNRVIPVIRALRALQEDLFPNARISIDTYKSLVAHEAICAGADIVNDVWGMQRDLDMASVVAKYQVPIIAMHNQDHTHYDGDIMLAMRTFFDRTLQLAKSNKISLDQIILDPGIGFGKTPDHNLEVLRRLNEMKAWGFPVLLGTSRKSTIGKVLDLPVDQRLEGTLATTVLGVKDGVKVFRVHDIIENKRAIQMAEAILFHRVPWEV